MPRRSTSHLLDALSSSESIHEYLDSCQNELVEQTIGERLTALAQAKGLSKAEIFKRSDLNEIYGYQIFSDTRLPSRDKLLCLCIGMELTVQETDELLKSSGFARLYPRIKRDSVILYGLMNHATIHQINDMLYDSKLKSLHC